MSEGVMFEKLVEKSQTHRQAEQAKIQQAAAWQAELGQVRKKIRIDWLGKSLENLGIVAASEVTDEYVDVEGFRFSITGASDVLRSKGGFLKDYTPAEYKFARFNLTITNLALADEYRANRPSGGRAYCSWYQDVGICGGGDWNALAAQVLKVIECLKQEQAEAPERKARIDAEYAEQQRQAEAYKREQNERRAQAEAEYAERHARNEQIRLVREAREAQLRAEVAARFGVSVDAYDLLVEAIADTIERRRHTAYEE